MKCYTVIRRRSSIAAMRRSPLLVVLVAAGCAASAQTPDPLPSWNDGAAKRAITDFVKAVTTNGSPEFVAAAERVAVIDNDGTLWAEQPLYFQFLFAIDRVRAMAPRHPEWATTDPYKAVLSGDM